MRNITLPFLVFGMVLCANARAQLSDAITWRYGHAEHISTRADRVTEWPVAPCGHPGHEQRGLGPRPTDEQFEALRLEYRASPEYAERQAELQEAMEGVTPQMREMDEMLETLVETGVIAKAKVPTKARTRINRRRARRGLEPL